MGIASSARMATGGTGLIGRDEVTREATDPPERVADAALEAAKAEAQLLRVELSLCLVIVDLEEGERTEGAVAARGVEDGLALLAELLARATIVARSARSFSSFLWGRGRVDLPPLLGSGCARPAVVPRIGIGWRVPRRTSRERAHLRKARMYLIVALVGLGAVVLAEAAELLGLLP